MTVTAPIPSASVRMATTVKPGVRARVRAAYPISLRASSSQTNDRASRWTSFACSTPPNARRAAARLFGRQAAPDEVFFEQREMRFHLARELPFGPARSERVGEPPDEPSQM
jgi:hypothetical protein